MTCIVAYDIEDDKIRGRLARYLEKKGTRLQKSVFAVDVERHVFRKFTRQIEGIAGKEGKVAIFRLCIGCRRNAIKIDEEGSIFFVV
ncbi:MAG TPA: CRISPR-associated endonuclease Cas2 [Syntrophales bacterium]|jgi:CRISPR-associated endonuclease Cas2|nr:CRISPR-associated endonuclease Cas2 [Syntrophales bacterium]HPC32369.1 CRISPR-associated endonuclease Cas2 [Syntrophales bacterium]HQG35015.1 CRISPR-associated endonuclease Cas2 [Syntrophales bacterium]HQI36593.1 CRISPR-associated endonuclease Cas2 [Syntrophales bacterium]HQJ30510.1 CRISPR-associated endonuclease Cas2 [Syntrophales bacterium]